MTKQSDEETASYFYLSNWIVFSEDKRNHSGNTNPGEYGASTEWYVWMGEDEEQLTIDIANELYSADVIDN